MRSEGPCLVNVLVDTRGGPGSIPATIRPASCVVVRVCRREKRHAVSKPSYPECAPGSSSNGHNLRVFWKGKLSGPALGLLNPNSYLNKVPDDSCAHQHLRNFSADQQCYTGTDFAPTGAFFNVWRHFHLSQLGARMDDALGGGQRY